MTRELCAGNVEPERRATVDTKDRVAEINRARAARVLVLDPLDEARELVVTNARGGQQHGIPVRYQDIDPGALEELAHVMWEGVELSGYDPENWRKIDPDDHFNHALAHLIAWKLFGKHEDAVHALARTMMLTACDRRTP
jgi:hypothetical protein